MKKKILTRANALIVMLLGMLGFAGCEGPLVKYGAPDPGMEVLYGPAPFEEVDTTSTEEPHEESPAIPLNE